MGVDIYLKSVFEPFMEQFEPVAPVPSANGVVDGMAYLNAHLDRLCASDAYFRNGYNAGDIMFAMGLSWDGTVGPMLDSDRTLPVARARELIGIIEARPLTRDAVAMHIFQHLSDGVDVGAPAMMDKIIAEEEGEPAPKKAPPDLDHLHAFLNTRRDRLLALLRRSVELGEPLAVIL